MALLDREEKLAEVLLQADNPDRLSAARKLWEERSRRHSTKVLQYLAGPPPGGEPFRTFQKEVEAALQPQEIHKELRDGDYEWGAWLAFLRPHKGLIPTLLAALKDKPRMLPETTLALGNSGDPRALDPLLDLLKSKDYRTAGDAARALRYFGDRKTEPALIAALATDNPWRQVQACGALATFGTKAALSELERVAKDDRFTGALAVKSTAEEALKAIRAREKQKK